MDTIAQAIEKFMLIGAEAEIMRHACLEEAGRMFVERAKAAIGTYEYGWPKLAEATVARKAKGDTPLLETGELKESFSYEAHSLTGNVMIGSSDPKIIYSEWGTKHEPPRPIIGGTIDTHGRAIADRMGVIFGMVMEEALAVGNTATAARNILGGMYR